MIEDPVTGELMPSSGRRGRGKSSPVTAMPSEGKKDTDDYGLMHEEQKKECARRDAAMARLGAENTRLRAGIRMIMNGVSRIAGEPSRWAG